jgi:hypothetical protein
MDVPLQVSILWKLWATEYTELCNESNTPINSKYWLQQLGAIPLGFQSVRTAVFGEGLPFRELNFDVINA